MRPSRARIAPIVVLAMLILSAALPRSVLWVPWEMGLIPVILAVYAFRASALVSVYLMQVAVYFGFTSIYLGSTWSDEVSISVLTWSAAVALGGTFVRSRSLTLPERQFRGPPTTEGGLTSVHFLVVGAVVLLYGYLVFSSRVGYEAQILTGRTTPAGLLGVLSSASPLLVLTLLLESMRRNSRVTLALLTALVQLGFLGLSGFRGAAASFVVAGLIGTWLLVPATSPWKQPRRVFLAAPALVGIVMASAFLGASVKNSAADELGVQSAGTQELRIDKFAETAALRLQLAAYLEAAAQNRHSDAARDAVGWEQQVKALVPRLMWPGKPNVDYGQRVSVAFFGLKYGQSSSTLTIVGDALVNFGLIGVSLIGILIGVLLRGLERVAHPRISGLALPFVVVAISLVIRLEQPFLLLLIGLLRDFVVVALVWGCAGLIGGRTEVNIPDRADGYPGPNRAAMMH